MALSADRSEVRRVERDARVADVLRRERRDVVNDLGRRVDPTLEAVLA